MVLDSGSTMAPPLVPGPPQHPMQNHSLSHAGGPMSQYPPANQQMSYNPQMNMAQQSHHLRGGHHAGGYSSGAGQMMPMNGHQPPPPHHPSSYGHQRPMPSHPPPMVHQQAGMMNGSNVQHGQHTMQMQQPLHQQQAAPSHWQQQPPQSAIPPRQQPHSHMQPPQQQPYQQHPQHQQYQQPPVQPQRPSSQTSSQHNHPLSQPQSVTAASGLNGNWQNDEHDMWYRRAMIQDIVKLLKQRDRKSASNPEWLGKLPQMVKQLEVSLYKSAPSFEAYKDVTTLKSRLQQLAQEISVRSQRGPGDSSSRRTSSHSRNDAPNGSSHQTAAMPIMPPQQRSRTSSQQQSQPQVRGMQQMHPQQQPGGRNMLSTMDLNPTMSNNGVDHSQSTNSDSPSFYPTPLGNDMNQGSFGTSQSSSQMPMLANRSTTPGGSWPQSRPSESDGRVRQKQQRLLLLHHSSKCPVPEGDSCSVTPFCGEMKKLWRHMARCRDSLCRVAHCFSSRAVLSHYKKCKEEHCLTCRPVRDEVKRTSMRDSEASLPDIHRPDSRSSSVNSQPTYHHARQNERIQFPNNATDNISPLNPSRALPLADTSNTFMETTNTYAPSMQQPSTNIFSGTSSSLPTNSFIASQQPPAGRPALNNTGSNDWGSQHLSDADTDAKVKIKQQRLLMLRHASKCQAEDGKCPLTSHCGMMKQLWKHIAECKEQKCEVAHCISSRYVLSHYRKCKDSNCQICEPVRETLRQQGRPAEKVLPTAPNSSEPIREPKRPKPNDFVCQPITYPPPTEPLSDSVIKNNLPTEPSPVKPTSPIMQPAVESSNGAVKPTSTTTVEPPPKVEPAAPTTSLPNAPGAQTAATDGALRYQDVYSLLESFTTEQIQIHTHSLNRMLDLPPVKLKSRCMEILKPLMNHQNGWVFNVPVDPVELNLPDYFDIVKRPMDLGTVQRRLENGNYHSIEDFEYDVNLTFDNAMTYNQEGSVVHTMAREMKDQFVADYQKLLEQLKKEDDERRKNERACTLCGCEKLLFEPPVYFCSGLNCPSNRIRRNTHYYVGGNNQYFWCNQCYNELKESEPIEIMDIKIKKSEMKRKKNDEIHEESWVECEVCNRWIHQICALFNSRQNTNSKEHTKKYHCPHCLLEKVKDGTDVKHQPMPKPLMAEDLPRTKLSQWLEYHVRKKVKEHRDACINDHTESAGALAEAGLLVDVADHITIRQVTAMDQKVEVRERMLKRYKNYPSEFPYRCKCIVVFQNLDGVDVLLFALYVYEHGPDNEAPNKRVVYISYLDSVHFMRPRRLRTFVYHEILISYLDYARKKGFSTVHIWACPPLKGDDYIFYAKPKDQKTPRDDRLRQWYIDMLTECQRRGICGLVTNMYDRYFSGKINNATVLPYLEGDYFPGEAENIIKDLDEGGVAKKKSSGKKSKKKKGENMSVADLGKVSKDGKKSKSKSRCTRASADDSGSESEDNGLIYDPVMAKLGETIKPMKESFIVAYLNWEGACAEDMVVPKEITEHREMRRSEMEKGKKRDFNGSLREEPMDPSITRNYLKDSHGRTVKVIDDDNDDLDCEFFNNRQSFLNLCRGNHYQFDELRRAKHSSMMVLWHLHNRGAPKFVQQCAACNREILSGVRHHCSTCTPDFDLCDECFKNPSTDRGQCNHNLEAIQVESPQSSGTCKLTAAAREERQRSIRLHIQLLEHASGCNSGTCTSSNCQKMRGFLSHERQCQEKSQGTCKICKRIWTLLRIHAQQCKARTCHIPQCNAIRERIRQIQKQQQAMDDRRRQEMNRAYRHGSGVTENR